MAAIACGWWTKKKRNRQHRSQWMAASHFAHVPTDRLKVMLDTVTEQYLLMVSSVAQGGQSAALAEQSRFDIEAKIDGIQEVLVNRGELTDEVAQYHHRQSYIDLRRGRYVDQIAKLEQDCA